MPPAKRRRNAGVATGYTIRTFMVRCTLIERYTLRVFITERFNGNVGSGRPTGAIPNRRTPFLLLSSYPNKR